MPSKWFFTCLSWFHVPRGPRASLQKLTGFMETLPEKRVSKDVYQYNVSCQHWVVGQEDFYLLCNAFFFGLPRGSLGSDKV